MSLVRGLTEVGAKAAKKTAPFYSAVDEALANLKRPKGTGAEFLTEVMKQPGVKKAEIADRKLEQAFKAKGKMTKEEAQQVLKENPPANLGEKVLKESDLEYYDDIVDRLSHERYGTNFNNLAGYEMRDVSREADRIFETQEAVKYNDYKTPGGKNYREILLKLPQAFTEREANRIMELEANLRRGEIPEKQMQELIALKNKQHNAPQDYRTVHWKEDPNVLAHMRVQDRTGPNGEKILHVEEIQSDWHQEGRKKGYATGREEQDYVDYLKDLELKAKNDAKKDFISEGIAEDRAEVLADRMAKRLAEDPRHLADYFGGDVRARQMELNQARMNARSGVPDAPFKKNWHELAMKRLLNYAADNGYDSIALTPGAEQAERYKLSKHIDSIMLTPNQYGNKDTHPFYFKAFDKQGNRVADDIVNEDKLAEYIGKEPAKQLLSAPVNPMGERMISGADIVTGGEGMKGFYDKILPDYLNSFGKPYNAQVELHKTPVSTRDPMDTSWSGGQGEHPFITSQDITERYDGMVDLLRRNEEGGEHTLVGRMLRADAQRRMAEELQKLDTVNQIKLHTFPITPEMRESIKQKGLPLYQQIGIPPAGAGAASQAPEEPEYGVGGSVAKMTALAKLQKLKEEMKPRADAVKNLMAMDKDKYLQDVTPNVLTNPEIEAEIARMKARSEALQPEVKLADGGAINYNTAPDMSDGGRIIQGAPFKRGGKVNMTANRDTMFMELSNKKLKRK